VRTGLPLIPWPVEVFRTGSDATILMTRGMRMANIPSAASKRASRGWLKPPTVWRVRPTHAKLNLMQVSCRAFLAQNGGASFREVGSCTS
jgi:hypothetical protein